MFGFKGNTFILVIVYDFVSYYDVQSILKGQMEAIFSF